LDKPQPSIEFNRSAPIVARQLIGATLLLNEVGGVIVETEAYDEAEPASHSFPGPTQRNAVLFGAPGHAYVWHPLVS
jgi:DNA-3-methyladenine glycosylase